jgi:peptidyl-prolyl isomerase E (cyclophilin E)
MADISRARRALYVGGLDEKVTSDVLKASFLPFGEVTDVQLPLDIKTQQNKGFAFVEFAEEEDASDAVKNMNNSELFGRVIKVNIAKMRPGGGAGGAGGKAVWADADEWYKALRESGEDLGEEEAGNALKEGGSSSSVGAGAGGAKGR